MEKYVRYRQVSWHQEVEDALGNKVVAERYAIHGQVLSTDSQPENEEDRKVNFVYDVPEKEIQRLANLPDGGAFFTDDEVAAMKAGVTDFQGEQTGEEFVTGDTRTSLSEGALGPDGLGAALGGGHPLSFNEMNSEQLGQWMEAESPSADKLIEMAYANPLMMANILDAMALVDYPESDAVAAGLAAVAGAGGSAENPPDSGEGEGQQGHGTGDGGAEPETEPETEEETEQVVAPAKNASTDEWRSFFESQGLSVTDDDGNDKGRDAMAEEWEASQSE